MKDEEEIPDAKNTDKLNIASFCSENQGEYSCIVSGGQQSVESEPALLALGTMILIVNFSDVTCC